jgi:hypothetical protein
MQRWKWSAALIVALCLHAAGAEAAYLYWASVKVKTASVGTCMNFAHGTLSGLNYQGIRVSASEVAGSANGVYVAITCLGTPGRATAMVMAVGEQGAPVAQARDRVRDRIAGMILFDD